MSKTNTCPQCGETAQGNFCANCGATLGGRFCNQCGTRAEAGDRFCKECGAGLGAAGAGVPAAAASGGAGKGGRRGGASSGSGGSSDVGWWVAGGMLVVVIFFMVMPLVTEDESATALPNAPFAAGGASGVPTSATTDLSSMTPREAADRLYERVMRSAAANDSNQVVMFLPMSIQAYDQARPLDADGLFHLSRLQRMALQDEAALASAEAGLDENPDHLLNLYAAGDAALALGQEEEGREYLSRLLEVWDAEMASGNVDYQLHSGMMPDIRAFAEQNAAGE